MRVALFLLFVTTALAAPVSEDEELLRSSIDELVRKTLEYARWLQQRHQPYAFPPLPEQTLVDDDVNIKFSTSNVLVSKAADFTIDKVSNNLQTLTSSFGITIPLAHWEGNYKVSGVAGEKKVEGSGTFKIDVTQFSQTGDIQFTIIDHSLQIQDLKLDYQIGGAKFDIDGLSIEGMSKEEIENFLNNKLISFLEEHKDFVCKKVADHAKEVTNKVLKGHSLQDVLDFLKQLVASTPDPPPYPTLSP